MYQILFSRNAEKFLATLQKRNRRLFKGGCYVHKSSSNFGFKLMAFEFKIRDLLVPRKNILKEVGIQTGFSVLDYGCGPASYVAVAAKLVGCSGKIYALDVHPLAIERVKEVVARERLTNVETILSDCKTGLPDESIDVVLLYDTFHDLSKPPEVLGELHRVLKPNGILSFSDHHMKEDDIVSELTKNGLFKLLKKGRKTYSFLKQA